jgi:hypothetical protein
MDRARDCEIPKSFKNGLGLHYDGFEDNIDGYIGRFFGFRGRDTRHCWKKGVLKTWNRNNEFPFSCVKHRWDVLK